jgi:hypothetical protein
MQCCDAIERNGMPEGIVEELRANTNPASQYPERAAAASTQSAKRSEFH